MLKLKGLLYLILFATIINQLALALPNNFVYLKDIDSSIVQDLRYAQLHNFIGRPLRGYEAKKCILTIDVAYALRRIQKQLKPYNLGLKVYDCYRPQAAVQDALTWSQNESLQEMKSEFYPRIAKKDLFALEYLAFHSGHSRGSTVDLTIVPLPIPKEPQYIPGQNLVACFRNRELRFFDNSIDMGSGFDCFDSISAITSHLINIHAYKNRQFLRQIMMKNDFVPYNKEWWHFTFRKEKFPHSYFNFKIR